MLDQNIRSGLLDRIEEHKGDDEYFQMLYSTPNSFTLSWPAMNRSITVDKRSLKTQEHDLFNGDESTNVEADQVCGFLGILQIYGLDHFVIATERSHVCDLPTYKQPITNATTAGVYALKKVKLIPFEREEESKSGAAANKYNWEKIEEVTQKITKYLQVGFYFSYNYDLTSNLQRQRKLHEEHGFAAKGYIQENFSWNRNMFQKIQAQSIAQFWCTHLMQGFVDRQSIQGKLDLVLIARRGAERGGTRFLHRGIDERGFVANFVELEQIVLRQEAGNQHLYSYAQIRGTFPFFWTQPNVSKFVIEKDVQAAKPYFEQHMRMLFDRYTEEVPDDQIKKILSMNLVKDNEGDKERMLAEYYEQLLDMSREEFKAEGKEIVYQNFPWHAETKNGTETFTELLKSLDDDYLRGFGIYHETRNNFTKQGTVQSWQKGLVRTNCIDCLDRTNVAKMMTCQKAFDDFVWRGIEEIQSDYSDEEDRQAKAAQLKQEVDRAMICMWAYAGDIISKIYSGTASVLTAVTLKGHEDLSDKLTHYATSANRWQLQKFSDEFKHECIQILRGQHESSIHSLQNIIGAGLSQISPNSMKPLQKAKCLLQVATINCYFRLPTQFDNLSALFVNNANGDGNANQTIDVYCINLQQIVYRGKRTFFSGDAEQAPGRAWLAAIPEQLKKANPKCQDDYVCIASQIAYTTLTALFVRSPFVKQVYASNGPSVNIATGIGGRRCSKRGSVSLNFKVQDSNFRIINMHLKNDNFANRLRDLSKILNVHKMAIEDQGCNIFLVGAVNFSLKSEFAQQGAAAASEPRASSRKSCEWLSLKQSQREGKPRRDSIPGISLDEARQKQINTDCILDVIDRIQEGDIDNGIIARVRNQMEAGLTQSLYHDRIFWLDSNYIQNLDYDVRTTEMPNNRERRQFKCIAALFNVIGLELEKEDTNRLLGQHFQLQTMRTQRELKKDQIKSAEENKMLIEEEDENESEELGVEEYLEDQIEEEKKQQEAMSRDSARPEQNSLGLLDSKHMAKPMGLLDTRESQNLTRDLGQDSNMIFNNPANGSAPQHLNQSANELKVSSITEKTEIREASLNLEDLGAPGLITRDSQISRGSDLQNQ